ncbi:hypothetical protein ACFFJY_17935 [Fictibacillus aquaticus]|uniref:Dimethylamine monooxygenase subunit DmmA-like C-terminal domain-containing protein n=1 Tax=Fictibacillus aquaticus TaxID=2021314 RepID=A0A235F5J8_9BACL|nr:hypothetical protein [Fictibacillus aquaticus]OYD56576.1 hypothetical protein CGZ90_16320 [Fictibacillus aquaticus]
MKKVRKYIIIADEKGLELLRPLFRHSMTVEMLSFNEELADQLARQKIGTYLYAALPWQQLAQVRKWAEDAGFSDEEAEYMGYGEKEQHVYCCRCHAVGKDTVKCGECGLLLELSDHYSSLHDAYLAYPVL